MRSILGANLAELRKEIGKSQQDTADELKISKTSLGNYERGKNTPNADMLCRLADYYGVSVDYLLGRVRSEFDVKILDKNFYRSKSCGDTMKSIVLLSDKSKELLSNYIRFLQEEDKRR